MLAEQLEIVLGAWSEAPFSFDGDHYRLSELDARPRPTQRPQLIMGGSAGPRSAALAARFADEYNTAFPTLEDVRKRKQAVGAACEEAGRGPIPFSVMTGFVVGRDRAEFEHRVRRLGERTGQDADAFMRDRPAPWITGTLEEAAEQLNALKEEGVSRVMCQHLLHDDLEAVALLGSELRPRLR